MRRKPTLRSALTWLATAALVLVPGVAVLGQSAGDNSVPPLMSVRGILEPCGVDLCVDGVVVAFGPWWHLAETRLIDLDGDGVIQNLIEELAALIGTEVLLEVELGSDDADVYVVNGLPWRDLDGPPPWSGGPGSAADDVPDGGPPFDPPGPPDEVPVGPPDGLPLGPPRGVPPGSVGEDDEPEELDTVTGVLTRCGEEWCIGGQVAEFGPWWYLNGTQGSADLDGDGTVESLAMELEGLEGTTVTLTVNRGGGDPEVFTVNGAAWRAEAGVPPWARGPGADGVRTGPPRGIGPPDHAGPPKGAGPPDHAGPPKGAGRPGG